MTLQPASRKRIGVVVLAAGLVLAGERMTSLASSGDSSADDLAPPMRPQGAGGTDRQAPADSGPATGRSATRPSPASAPALRLDRLDARVQGPTGEVADLFAAPPRAASAAAKPAPPPVPAPAAAEEPVPPFPYRYMGGMVDGGVRSAYFLQGERVLALRAGDVVDRRFRIDDIAADRIMITFLPRNAPLTVNLGAAR